MDDRPTTILIVDDSRAIRISLRAFLEEYGFEIIEAENGRQGLEVFRRENPDLMLVDLWMPEMGGIELLNTVSQESSDTPMIVVSGTGVIGEVVEAIHAGAWDYVQKPITDLDVFHHIIKKTLERARLIIENREQKNRLELRKAELELLLDNIETQIWYLEDENTYGAINQAHVDFIGVSKKDLEHSDIKKLIGEKNKQLFIGHGHEVFQSKKQVHSEEWSTNSQGESRLLSITRTPMIDSSGKVELVVCSALDVTEQKQAEEALKRAKRVAEEASESKARWLANMSHEIRLPMNGVLGMTELLLESDLPPEQRDYAETIMNSAEALLTVLNDILDFSKADAGKIELETLEFNLQDTIEDILDLLAPSAREKGLELIGMVEPDVPTLLLGDPGRIRQIIINLLGNAIKFTAKGEVVLRANLKQDDEHKTTLHFEVIDTGIGIPAERQEMVFEPFTQVDSSTTRQYGGTGLGLSIASQLIKMMGGEIGLESVEGEGTTFWFTLLLAKQSPSKESAKVLPGGRGKNRVLVIDGNQTMRKYLSALLNGWQCKVDAAVDAGSALLSIDKAVEEGDPFNIVILDMNLPDMEGISFAYKIKELPGQEATALILMAPMPMPKEGVGLGGSIFSGHLIKPVRRDRLFDCLVRAVGEDTKKREIAIELAGEQEIPMRRILVAEDDLVSRKVLIGMLRKSGFSVNSVRNGNEAIVLIENISFSLVLMDCQMPDMDGYEATRLIRESSMANRAIPIVAMTASTLKEDHEKCLAVGMDRVLTKPIRLYELEEIIGDILGDKGRSEFVDKSTTSSENSDNKVLNFEVALAFLEGDRSLLRVAWSAFSDDAPKKRELLREAVKAGDADSIEILAHSLKSSCGSVGAQILREAAIQMEIAAKKRDMESVLQIHKKIESEFEKLFSILPEYLAGLTDDTL